MFAHKREAYLHTQKTPTQPPFSVDYNFVNSASRVIGFYANGIFCFQRPTKNTLVIVKIILSGNSRIFSSKPDFISCLVMRLEEFSTWLTCSETPVSTAAKPHSSRHGLASKVLSALRRSGSVWKKLWHHPLHSKYHYGVPKVLTDTILLFPMPSERGNWWRKRAQKCNTCYHLKANSSERRMISRLVEAQKTRQLLGVFFYILFQNSRSKRKKKHPKNKQIKK